MTPHKWKKTGLWSNTDNVLLFEYRCDRCSKAVFAGYIENIKHHRYSIPEDCDLAIIIAVNGS